MTSPKKYEEWIAVYSSSTDYEADLVRDRLDNADIPAVVLTQRDHAFNLNVGDLSLVHVMVPPEHEITARKVLEDLSFTDEELTEAAMSADVEAPDAHDSDQEAWLDSGSESLHLRRSEASEKKPATSEGRGSEKTDDSEEGS